MAQAAPTQAPAKTQAGPLTTLKNRALTIGAFLNSKKGAFEALLPKHLTAEKMVKGIFAAAARNPKLLECTVESILNCVLVGATLGLPMGLRGVHPVPFWNSKTRRMEAVPIPDYRGLIDLAYRSGFVLSMRVVPFFHGEKFEHHEGNEQRVVHVPGEDVEWNWKNLRGVYFVGVTRDTPIPFVRVLYKKEIELHRAKSPAWNAKDGKHFGPWSEEGLGEIAMAIKTGVKVGANFLPSAPERLIQALELDGRVDRGEGFADLFDVEITGEDMGAVEDPGSRTNKVMEDLEQRTAKTGDGAEQNQQGAPAADEDDGQDSAAWAGTYTTPEERAKHAPRIRGDSVRKRLEPFVAGLVDAFEHGDPAVWWEETGRGIFNQEQDAYAQARMRALCVYYCGPTWMGAA